MSEENSNFHATTFMPVARPASIASIATFDDWHAYCSLMPDRCKLRRA
jgi:hypothetical protein